MLPANVDLSNMALPTNLALSNLVRLVNAAMSNALVNLAPLNVTSPINTAFSNVTPSANSAPRNEVSPVKRARSKRALLMRPGLLGDPFPQGVCAGDIGLVAVFCSSAISAVRCRRAASGSAAGAHHDGASGADRVQLHAR